MMNYAEVLNELNQYTNYERTADYPVGAHGLSTARMEKLLALLNSPEQNFVAIHIAGTKGKGSTAHLTAALLRALKVRVGLYTSPHIICLRERVQIDGRIIAQNDFIDAYQKVKIAAEKLNDRPTFFEMITAIALQIFSDAKIEVAVIEVGLGGRLDATNVATLPVAVSGISKISYDHTKILGATLDAIAQEKAGILRSRTPLVIAPQTHKADLVIRQRGEELNCPITTVGKNILCFANKARATKSGQQFFDLRICDLAEEGTFKDILEREYEKVPLNLLGAHQRENAAMALGLVAQLYVTRPTKILITHTHLTTAWKNIRLPGRIEIVNTEPLTILDGAHNPASAWMLIETLREIITHNENIRGKKIGVCSINQDKNSAEILRIILPFFDEVIFTVNNSSRHTETAELQKIANTVAPSIATIVINDPITALHAAQLSAGAEGLICVTGSFYLIGDVRAHCLRIPVEE